MISYITIIYQRHFLKLIYHCLTEPHWHQYDQIWRAETSRAYNSKAVRKLVCRKFIAVGAKILDLATEAFKKLFFYT